MRRRVVIKQVECYIITIKCCGNKPVRFAFAIFLFFYSQLTLAGELLVSTHPLYLIAQEVTQGVEKPSLLLTPQQSGHDVQLTPKARQLIQSASLVVWLGQAHEAPLKQALKGKDNAIALLDSSIIKVLPQRNARGETISGTQDTHVWLEPHNAVRIAFFIAGLRSQQYPEHKAQYWKNAQNFSKKMYDATKVDLVQKEQPYWAYHDAYQYLERPLNLKFAGALSIDHELTPTAAQIQFLNRNRPQKNMCLLAESHVDQAFINMLKPVNSISVDESMSTETDFVSGWIKLANAVKQCK